MKAYQIVRCVAVAAPLLLAASQSEAGKITLDIVGAWSLMDFKKADDDQVRVAHTSPIFSLADYQASSFGWVTFGPIDAVTDPKGPFGFPLMASEMIEYNSTIGGPDRFSGSVDWYRLDDGTLPSLFGTLTVASASGTAAFLGDFYAGSAANIRMQFELGCSLADLVAGHCPDAIEEGVLCSGEIVPTSTPVPEPSMALTFGAVFGAFLWLRSKLA